MIWFIFLSNKWNGRYNLELKIKISPTIFDEYTRNFSWEYSFVLSIYWPQYKKINNAMFIKYNNLSLVFIEGFSSLLISWIDLKLKYRVFRYHDRDFGISSTVNLWIVTNTVSTVQSFFSRGAPIYNGTRIGLLTAINWNLFQV